MRNAAPLPLPPPKLKQQEEFSKISVKKKKRQLSLQSNSLPETESAINIKSGQKKIADINFNWGGGRRIFKKSRPM